MPAEPLSGLRVLVTRPQRQAGKWQALLQRQGAATLRAPLMEISPFEIGERRPENDAIESRLTKLDQYQHLIFVSQNAAHCGLQWISHCNARIADNAQCYAVGTATAERLQQEQLTVTAAGNTMNTEALLALPQLQDVDGSQILIMRGQGGRPLLAKILEERGAKVDYLELYQRVQPATTTEQLNNSDWGQAGDIVALHSGESLQNWHNVIEQLQKPEWLQIPVLIPGVRVQQLAQSLGFSSIITADNATDREMSQSLSSWHRQQHRN